MLSTHKRSPILRHSCKLILANGALEKIRMHALDTPWKAFNEMRRIVFTPFYRLYFALHGVAWQPGWRMFGLPLIQKHRGSEIHIGSYLQMRNWFGSNPLGVNHR